MRRQGIEVKVIPGSASSRYANIFIAELIFLLTHRGVANWYGLTILGLTYCTGITSTSGIAAELGIPLTHRGVANRYSLNNP